MKPHAPEPLPPSPLFERAGSSDGPNARSRTATLAPRRQRAGAAGSAAANARKIDRWVERDRWLARAMHRATADPLLLAVLAAASRLGDGMVWYAALLALPWFGGPHGTACMLRMLLLGALDLVMYRIIKRHFARPRPFVDCPDVRACARCLDEHSFPSGHVLHAVAFGTVLCAYYPALAWLVWPFAALVAASRIVLGLHFPSDVVVGAALGAFMGSAVLVLF